MKPAYKWCDDRGVVAIGKKDDTQAIQLLVGPASYAFRSLCGNLLVEALNNEVEQQKRMTAHLKRRTRKRAAK